MRRVHGAVTLALVLGCLGVGPGRAQEASEELLTDRPDFTETTRAVRRGQVQIEGGLTFARHENGDLDTWNAPEVLLRTGVTRGVELRLGLDVAWTKRSPPTTTDPAYSADGLGNWSDAEPVDGYVGAKIELWNRDDWGLALIPALAWPMVDQTDMDPELVVAWSRDLTSVWSVGGIVGYTFGDFDEERTLGSTVSFARPFAGGIGAFVEWAGERSDHESTHLLHHGYTLSIGPNAQLDLHVGVGLDEDAPDTFVGAGFAVRL